MSQSHVGHLGREVVSGLSLFTFNRWSHGIYVTPDCDLITLFETLGFVSGMHIYNICTGMHACMSASYSHLRSMRGGFIFRNQGPSLKVHHGQCVTSMTKHDSGGSPPRAACNSAKQPHGKTAVTIMFTVTLFRLPYPHAPHCSSLVNFCASHVIWDGALC
jgi:hypothetical protein